MDKTIKSATSEQHVTDTIKNLKALTDSVDEINKKMYSQLVEIVKSKGGFMRTDKQGNMDTILKCILVYDSVQTIDSERLIDRWLKYFAYELGVKIKTTTDKDGKKSVYVKGYSK